jgi:type II secretory pathway pseudopilin PulG
MKISNKGLAPSPSEHHFFAKRSARFRAGFTLLEFLIAFAIFLAIVGAIGTLFRDLLWTGTNFQNSFLIGQLSQGVVEEMAAEIREAQTSDLGGYPLQIAASTSLAFYANIDNDVERERVQYFISGSTLKKSVVNPAGNPLTYSTTTAASETLRTVLNNVQVSSTTGIFLYRSNGATTTSQVTIDTIRLVIIRLLIDEDPNLPPAPFLADAIVNIRNLKDY